MQPDERKETEVTSVEQAQAYDPPKILWEEEFIALAQISPVPCVPGQGPICTP